MWRGQGHPLRLKVFEPGEELRDNYGGWLTPEIALSPSGPLDGSGLGMLTRWMGVPWLTDEASYLSGYTNGITGWMTSGDRGDVGQFWVAEEAAEDVRQALQPA